MNRKKKTFLWMALLCLGSVVGGAYYVFLTTDGAHRLARLLAKSSVPADHVVYETVRGDLRQGVEYRNLEFQGLDIFPEGSILRVQRLYVDLNAFNIRALTVEVENARLTLPYSEPIVLNGDLSRGQWKVNLFSKAVDLKDIFEFIPMPELNTISGQVEDVDLMVGGDFDSPTVNGGFFVAQLSREEFLAREAPAQVALMLKINGSQVLMHGEVKVEKADVSGPQTATVQLQPSRLVFSGAPDQPVLNIRGTSRVDGVRIEVRASGPLAKPELELWSEPSMPQPHLLVMLATNRRWKGVEESLTQGQISPDIAKDFIDYFALAGTGAKMAEHLGIKDITVKFEKNTKAMGFTKTITGNLDGKYLIEQSVDDQGQPQTSQRIGGSIRVTDQISVEGQRQITQTINEQTNSQENIPNDQLMIKYKTLF